MCKTTLSGRACAALIAMVFLACNDESSPTKVQPPEPRLDNIWPHEDQRSWTYKLVQYQGTVFNWPDCAAYCFATPGEVPPAPSLDDIAALVGNQPLPQDSVRVNGACRIQFDGERTTESGFTGQNLTQTLYEEIPEVDRPVDAMPAPYFFSVLAAARPDLRPEILARAPDIETLASQAIDPPLFLTESAWVKTATEIGAYSEVDTILGWKYLEADLTVGHEFVWPLVRPLADDVFMHARVTAEGTRATPIGSFSNAIDVLYMVDFGVGEFTDEFGSTIVYVRFISYGEMTYAPDAGPIAMLERNLVLVGTTGLDRGLTDTTLDLIGTGLPAPPTMGINDRSLR